MTQQHTSASLTTPTIGPQVAIELISRQIEKGDELLSARFMDEGDYSAWENTTREYLIQAFGSASGNLRSFSSAGAPATIFDDYESRLPELLRKKLKILRSAIEQLEAQRELSPLPISDKITSAIKTVEQICQRFHVVARQLRARRENRATLDVEDEYDVQDLLHALLCLFFEDIRPEEWAPSYAGKSSRMDFLLKEEEVVVEVKKTRAGLAAKEIGSQLIEDIARYRSHAECKVLICFVYDPEGKISNPRGIERDLSQLEETEGMKVKVLIAPRGY